MKLNLFVAQLLCIFCSALFAQDLSTLTAEDKSALEGIIVEKYYTADVLDSLDTKLPKGSVTYRIYADLKPNYFLQTIYGDARHPLNIKTTTKFYNNPTCGALIGYNVHYLTLNDDNFAFDSWITINSASSQYAGVLLSEDTDGSVLKRRTFEKADGFAQGNLPMIKPFNLDINFFDNDTTASHFTTDNGAWAAFSGIRCGASGPTASNKILIAQLTTDGVISFDLSMQLGTPDGNSLRFVYKDAEPLEGEVLFAPLSLVEKKFEEKSKKKNKKSRNKKQQL
jgi:hypothetical protein